MGTAIFVHPGMEGKKDPFWAQAILYGCLSGLASIVIKLLYDRYKHKKMPIKTEEKRKITKE